MSEHVEIVAWANPKDLIDDGYSHSFSVQSSQPGNLFLDGGMAVGLIRESDYDALATQRDEGLAREAELKAQRDSLANEMFDLHQRQAEAKKLLAAHVENEEGFIFQHDLMQRTKEFLASPGFADGEKAK